MTSIWTHQPAIEELNKRGKNTLVEPLGIEFTEVGDDYIAARMPVDARTHQVMGLLHGGASCALGETVGSVGANFCIDKGQVAVGMEINMNHLRSVSEGWVIGKAWPWHIGKRSQVWQIEIRDESHRLISVGRITMAVKEFNMR